MNSENDMFISLLYRVMSTTANACHQQPKLRPHDGQHTAMWQQTIMREDFFKTTERGFGLLHGLLGKLPSIQAIIPHYVFHIIS